MKTNDFLDHLYGGIYYAANGNEIEDNKTAILYNSFGNYGFSFLKINILRNENP
jgi:hypothetical protein